MSEGKTKITTILLVIVSIFLLASAMYIGKLITTNDEGISTVAPEQSKAANITYSKLIALNTTPIQPAATETPTPPLVLTPTIMITETRMTPTPTEIILAQGNPSITEEATGEAEISSTTTSAKVKDLPDAGFIYNGLIIFAAATLLVFFSFLF